MSAVEDVIRDDSLTITWNIQNFSFNTCTEGKCFVSPEFETKKLGNSSWQIALYPNGSNCKDYIACNLIPRVEDTTSEYDKYSLTVSLSVDENELGKIEETLTAENSQIWVCHRFLKRDLLPHPLPNDALSICCIIQPETYNDPKSDHHQMESLSQNLIGLLESGEHHDLVLVTDNGERFKVHKCVMSARWPNLLRSGSVNLTASTNYRNCEPEIRVHEITPSVMKTMIRYAYSGTLEPNIGRDVFISAVNTHFKTLRKNLTTYPKMYSAVTNFKIERKTVVWHLDDISSWDTEPPSFIKILPITELHMHEIILVFSIKTDEDGNEAIDIAFRFSNIDEPTILKCKMSLSAANGTTSQFKSGEHLFQANHFWHFPNLFKKRDIPDKKRSWLTVDITLSDGLTSGRIEKSEIPFLNKFTPTPDLRKLSSDMATLTSMSVDPHPSDSALQCIDGFDIGTHRAILWARWPQLSRVMGVEANEIIKMNVSGLQLEDILHFVYTGDSGAITQSTAEKLMEINRTFPMPSPMLEMCRSVITDRREI